MPSLFQVRNYKIFFWSDENDEPLHVHIGVGKPSPNSTKIWITSKGGCIVAHNKSKIPDHHLNELLVIISAHYFLICNEWENFFGSNKIKYYC